MSGEMKIVRIKRKGNDAEVEILINEAQCPQACTSYTDTLLLKGFGNKPDNEIQCEVQKKVVDLWEKNRFEEMGITGGEGDAGQLVKLRRES